MEMSMTRKVRLPNDTAGLLQDRIVEEPLDFPAYEELINHLRSKSKIEEARQVFEQFLKVLPASAYVWRQYAEMEASENELNRVEALFGRALMASLHLDIWNYYLDYIRRTHPLSTGGTSARTVISQAYEFVLQHVGIDLESGPIWAEYLNFLKSAPAASSWEEQQRNDQLRKVYQRAVVTPLNNVEFLWREYNNFENGINKQTARKFLNEKSPAYMTARASAKELGALLSVLRSPKFPSRVTRTHSQEVYLSNWKKWIALEKSDPLELEDQTQLRNRVKYAIKQSHMFCRFHPQVWYDAAAYYESLSELETIQEATHTKPSATLKEGLTAIPDSWLLSFAYAEIEETAQRHENVKATFDNLIAKNESDLIKVDTDYKTKLDLARKEATAQLPNLKSNDSDSESNSGSEVDDTDATDNKRSPDTRLSLQTNSKLRGIEEERQQKLKQLSEEGTVAAIMYMRALRRMEGIKSARMCFANSIRSPHISWQIYVASALMEHQYDDSRPLERDGKAGVPIPVRIFTRGLKLFPDNHEYILEYLNFLLSIRDDKNARALFEQSTAKLDPSKARPLYKRWYQYESMYGDLTSAQKLGTRMADSDDGVSALSLFGQRFSYLGCDPIARRDLGVDGSVNTNDTAPSLPRIPPPHPLAFFQSQDMPMPIPVPGASGFNPPILPQFQKQASPLPVAVTPQPVISTPLPPPLHTALLNFLKSLPPKDAFNHDFIFNHQQILNVIRGLDLSKAKQTSGVVKVERPSSRQTTPQIVLQAPSIVPAKRTAQSMIPTPDDVVALGRHNDPKDPYKKRP